MLVSIFEEEYLICLFFFLAQVFTDCATNLVDGYSNKLHPAEEKPIEVIEVAEPAKGQTFDNDSIRPGISLLKRVLSRDDLVLVKCLLQLCERVNKAMLQQVKDVSATALN